MRAHLLPIVIVFGLAAPPLVAFARAEADDVPVTVITLGDSITRGVRPGVKADETFAAVLQVELRKKGVKVEVVNVGIGGERTDQALARLARDVLERKPAVVTILYGHNDSFIDKGRKEPRISSEEYRANLHKLVAELRKAGVRPILMTPPCYDKKAAPNGAGEHPNVRLEQYAKICREEARATKTPLVDHYARWSKALADGTDLADWTTDLYHPNPRGHQIMAELILPVVLEEIRVIRAPDKEPETNSWVRLAKTEIAGKRWDVPLGYDPLAKRFLILGGRSSWADYKKPRSYDVLALHEAEGWENLYPRGKEWGPKFGACNAPAWKDEVFHFRDTDGNTRPNWTVYGTFSLGQKYDYDPDTKSFLFYAGGHTFRYDPARREWLDLAPKTHPQQELGGILLWSSLCYDRHGKRFVLFGGGNVQSPRGDPGTWSYSPADNTWKNLSPEKQPPQRANSRLVFDPVHKKVVLFGGDQLDQLLADTWTFDVTTGEWEEIRPPRIPAPRAGHALLWLPKAKKVLLLGGYTYTSTTDYVASLYRPLPSEAWTFDVGTGQWELLRHFDAPAGAPASPANGFLCAAVDEEDRVVVVANGTWLCTIDSSKPDAAGAKKHGVASGATVRRTGPHDPAWFKEGVPPASPKKVEADLKALVPNRWTLRPTPKLARPNMDWGSAVFAPELDLILRFSGGHSAYSGTAPVVYDVKTDRYSLPFAPEYPIEYVYSNDQVHGEWSFKGNPWMTGHTYKSTGYDPNVKGLVFAPHEYTYFFDPALGRWSRGSERNPYRPNFYVVTVCATPEGAVVWADGRDGKAGLWRLDGSKRTWQPLPLTGALPDKSPDRHGMAFDSKRNRLLLFSEVGKKAGDVAAYDLKTGRAEWLAPMGGDKALCPSRETLYVSELDAVLIGGHVKGLDGEMLWPLYDCAKNAWLGLGLAGDDPAGKGKFNNSMGLMYDPGRKLVWAVGQNSHVYVVKIDPSSRARELK
jgi:lysophospholipase L1-like esterase